jgi:5-methylcytosine-specific restriction endonuclease McrA
MIYTKEQVTQACLSLFQQALDKLPPNISERLTCSRAARNHGSYRTVLLFNTWDRFQSDVFPKDHFCYCLAYDPQQLISGGSQWYFHLWLNTIRIYRDRLAIKSKLEKKLGAVAPKPFKIENLDRAVSIKINFELQRGPRSLVDYLAPHYVRLINAVHPVLMPIIDKYSVNVGRTEIKKEVAARGRISHKPVRTAHPELIRDYTRSIPPTWRLQILKVHKYRCAHCKTDLQSVGHHIDHIVPFSRGGTSERKNLQPLCPDCNLKKGNRSIK